MKIIDLLNKIANGEGVPMVKYDNVILKYNKNQKRFIDKDGLNSLYEIDFSELNDEVEIIEESKPITKKDIEEIGYCFGKIKESFENGWNRALKENNKIEKITINENGTLGFPNGCWTARNMDKAFAIKLNEVIEELEKRYEKQDK